MRCDVIAPRESRSSLRYPLDDILGSPGLVRLIRMLTYETVSPVGVADAARMAGLSSAGARKALMRLAALGIAERVGTGRTLKFCSKKENPFLHLLEKLFEKEHEHYENLIFTLRQILTIPEVLGAWITQLPLEIGQPLQLEITTDAKAISWIKEELRTRLAETEAKYDLIIELTLFTRADAPIPPNMAIILNGTGNPSRTDILLRRTTQMDSEERSLRLARSIARLIVLDPSLVKRARQYTNRLLHDDQGMAGKDVAEWRQLLETYSIDRIRDILVSSSSRSIRLRRSMPFLAVLTHQERDKMLEQMEMQDDEI